MMKHVWMIFVFFVALRIIFAFSLPIFNDESIYMRWGMGFLHQPERWWSYMLDGKQPAIAIFFGLAQKLPIEPLIAMRLVSILWSCITFWAMFAISKQLKLKQYALLLLAVCTYSILFDSLAIAESAIVAASTVLLWLSLSLIEKPVWWKAVSIGVVIAIGWWFKSTILLTIPTILVTLIIGWK
jgi:hypothetical protein